MGGDAFTNKKNNTDYFILCFCACPGVVLDIWEGQPRLPLRLTFWGNKEKKKTEKVQCQLREGEE